VDDYWPVGDEILGRVAELERLARAHFIDELIIAVDDVPTRRRAIRTAVACRLDVSLVPNLADCCAARLSQIGPWPLITLHEERPPTLALAVKRGIDVLGSCLGLLLTAPLLAFIALWIRLDSAGPVLYTAQRVGRKGARFRCYKFRTMSTDADVVKEKLRSQNQRTGAFFKIEHDPRITRCGRWLRRYSLDELPQLWNVVLGSMSLVGPRPHPLDDFARYQLADLCRLDVRPGLTGLWQTTARRDPSFQTNLRLDRQYIESWSLALDLRILLRTVRVVLAGEGC
jgi:exopolysaccharide biosynthesis polyprenyl glycosylphosphotransferase